MTQTSTQINIFQYFNKIIRKFNVSFLERFLLKIKLFLKNQQNTNDKDFTFCCITNLIENIIQYFKDKTDKEKPLQFNEQVINLFTFVFEEFEYDYSKPNQVIKMFIL